jgi:hypothetical protein
MKKFNKINEAELNMEEIIKLPYTSFVSKLKELAKDTKIQAIINAGKTDGQSEDEAFTFKEVAFDVKTLQPLQNEIDMDGSLMFPLSGKSDNLESILKGEAVTILGPVVIFQSGGVDYIIDGHHRWSGVYGINKDGKVNGIRLTANQKVDPTRVLKAAQLAIAALKKEVPTSAAKGVNLLTITQDALNKYIKTGEGSLKGFKGIQPETIKRFSEVNPELKDVDSICKFVWGNVASMQETCGTMWKKLNIKRDFMPQTDLGAEGEAKNAETRKTINKLASGEINFLQPKSDDVKEKTNKSDVPKKSEVATESRVINVGSRTIKTYEKFMQNWKK